MSVCKAFGTFRDMYDKSFAVVRQLPSLLRTCNLGTMRTAWLEAFSDGVIAIIITIMVLEMKVPPR